MFIRKQIKNGKTYYSLVRTYRKDGKVLQRVRGWNNKEPKGEEWHGKNPIDEVILNLLFPQECPPRSANDQRKEWSEYFRLRREAEKQVEEIRVSLYQKYPDVFTKETEKSIRINACSLEIDHMNALCRFAAKYRLEDFPLGELAHLKTALNFLVESEGSFAQKYPAIFLVNEEDYPAPTRRPKITDLTKVLEPRDGLEMAQIIGRACLQVLAVDRFFKNYKDYNAPFYDMKKFIAMYKRTARMLSEFFKPSAAIEGEVISEENTNLLT